MAGLTRHWTAEIATCGSASGDIEPAEIDMARAACCMPAMVRMKRGLAGALAPDDGGDGASSLSGAPSSAWAYAVENRQSRRSIFNIMPFFPVHDWSNFLRPPKRASRGGKPVPL